MTEACPHCKASHCKAHDCGEHATADQVTVCRLRNECWDLRAGLELAEQAIAAAEARAEAAEIRAHEARALLQRMAKCVREDNATTAGTTKLTRLTVQVTDYLQRTHDPRSILRGAPPKRTRNRRGSDER